jgi:hypothetical protein
LRPEEEGRASGEENILIHAEKLYQGCLEGEELLYEGERRLVSRLGRYGSKLRELANIDDGLRPTVALLESPGAAGRGQRGTPPLRRTGPLLSLGALEQSRTGWRRFTA